MIDEKALTDIAQQLGTLGVNLVSTKRDYEIAQGKVNEQEHQIAELNQKLADMQFERDELQRKLLELE